MSVFNPSNAPASPPERRAASDCGCDGSVGFPGSAAYILFDLDGTLTDPKEGITRCVQYALSKFGIQAECDALTNFIGPPLEESFGRFYGFRRRTAKKRSTITASALRTSAYLKTASSTAFPSCCLRFRARARFGAGDLQAAGVRRTDFGKIQSERPFQRHRGQRTGTAAAATRRRSSRWRWKSSACRTGARP